MKKKMLNIINQLEKKEITYEKARQQVSDLFAGSKRVKCNHNKIEYSEWGECFCAICGEHLRK